MKYVVVGLVSRSFDKVCGFEKWRKFTFKNGPYKSLKKAKRVRANLNKSRALFYDDNNTIKDYGPSFTRVWIDEVSE